MKDSTVINEAQKYLKQIDFLLGGIRNVINDLGHEIKEHGNENDYCGGFSYGAASGRRALRRLLKQFKKLEEKEEVYNGS